MPTGSSHASLTMAVLVAGGGVYGYIKARSLPSVCELQCANYSFRLRVCWCSQTITNLVHLCQQLMAGLTVGALFAGSGYMISVRDAHVPYTDHPTHTIPPPTQQGNAQAGHDLGALSSVALAGAMASRAAKTKKVMPAGMLAALGTVSAAYHIKKSLEWRGWAS